MDEVEVDLEESRKSKKKKKKKKVFVCHYSQESDSWKTIRISKKALKAHLRHGDYLGKCDETPEPGCTDIYVDGFETDDSGWIDKNSGWNGTAAMVASGTNGITSAAGGFHGLFEGDEFTAPRSIFDGLGNLWQGNWTAEIDVYFDPSWATSTGFEYTVEALGPNSGQILNFVFHVNKDASTGNLLVGASTDQTLLFFGELPREDLENGKNFVVTIAGWYKLQHVFYENGGNLSVDLNLLDGSGSILFTETFNTTNAIGGQTGSNNYSWFNYINVADGIAVDEHKRLDCSSTEELL